MSILSPATPPVPVLPPPSPYTHDAVLAELVKLWETREGAPQSIRSAAWTLRGACKAANVMYPDQPHQAFNALGDALGADHTLHGWPCSDGRTNPDGSITVWSDIRIQIEWAPGHVSKPAPVAGEERSSSLPFPSAFIE